VSDDSDDPRPANVDAAVHAKAMADGEDGYLDPRTGLFVLTADFLARRGFCCGNGCRHCPY
jgi:hypothetical protein